MVLRREECADVAVEDEVGLHGPLDCLLDGRVRLVDEVPDPSEEVPLPVGQGIEPGVDPRILRVRHELSLADWRVRDRTTTDGGRRRTRRDRAVRRAPCAVRDRRGRLSESDTFVQI